MEFLQYLIQKKLLTRSQGAELKAEVKKTGQSPEEVILKRKLIAENKLFKSKSQALKIPFREKLEKDISQDVLSVIGRESVEFYKVVPLSIDKKKKVLEVGMVYPEDNRAMEALKFLARQQKLNPSVSLITISDFEKYLSKYRAPEKEIERELERLKKEVGEEKKKKKVRPEELERMVEEAPVIKMVAVILRQAVEGKASDIHLEPSKENLKVRFRLDGVLYPSLYLPLSIHPAVVARIKIISGLKIDETRIPQDGRFSTEVNKQKIDFRVSTLPTSLGEKVVIRVLNPEEGLKTLFQLGIKETNLKTVKEAIEKPYGMILATGPTGSGKTTTLYAILRILNKEGVNIVTLEDPVEYFIEGVNQSQIRPEIKYTFASGLRSILRQDPDIIMVGEIRDEETASLAVHAGLTGHLVLSTLHTTNVLGIIPRLIDMGIEPFLIPPTMSLGISQRLIRRLCHHCRTKIKANNKEKKYILDRLKNIPPETAKKFKPKGNIYIYRPKGCEKCNFRGYSGRTGVYEVLKMTDELSKIVIEKSSEEAILKEARRQGMLSMEEDGVLKVLEGTTSLEEMVRVTEEL